MHASTRPDIRAGVRREIVYDSPFGAGRLTLVGDLPVAHELPDPRLTASAVGSGEPWAELLSAYFRGERVRFPLDVDAYATATRQSGFSRAVLRALAAVPYATPVSYGQLAAAAGHPGAHRAAGSVIARNEIPVLLPCHRVVRGDGSLGRYGDDPAWKRRLLELEGVDLSRWRQA